MSVVGRPNTLHVDSPGFIGEGVHMLQYFHFLKSVTRLALLRVYGNEAEVIRRKKNAAKFCSEDVTFSTSVSEYTRMDRITQ